MSKVAKLAFAMGGGVSLGSFSGAGLTQCIKQLILNGGYYEGDTFHHYSDIEIDVFSGASAGCISLGIMLRTLTDPESEFAYIPKGSTTPITLTFEGVRLELESSDEELKQRLAHASGDERERLLDLYTAAEITQRVQNNIWCNEINLKNLLGGAMRTVQGGIANKDALFKIAKKYFGSDVKINPKNRRLLADRVIFICTLANLDGLVLEGREKHSGLMESLDEMKEQAQRLALLDGGRSKTHRDYRVFDVNFNNLEDLEGVEEGELCYDDKTRHKYPRRWFRIYPWKDNASEEGRVSHNLNDMTTWRKICATSVGSGSIPPALEPTLLERYSWEYNPHVWNATVDVDVPSNNRVGDVEPGENDHKYTTDKHYFSYVDGGTFNNEPIREAHRAAAFIDNLEEMKPASERREFDRLIMFIDPYVDPSIHNLSQAYLTAKSDKYGATTRDERKLSNGETLKMKFGAIMGVVAPLVGALRSEGMVKEGLRITRYKNRITDNQTWAAKSSKELTANDELLHTLAKQLEAWFDGVRETEMLPPGPVTAMYGLLSYVRRIQTADLASAYAQLRGAELDGLESHLYELVAQGEDALEAIDRSHAAVLMRVLNLMNAERSGDTLYKRNASKLIAIAPLQIDKGKMDIQYLPGVGFGGFAGFASVNTNWFNTKSAAWSSDLCLRLHRVIHKPGEPIGEDELFTYLKSPAFNATKPDEKDAVIKDEFYALSGDIQSYVDDIVVGLFHLPKDKNKKGMGLWTKIKLGWSLLVTKEKKALREYISGKVGEAVKDVYLGMDKHTSVILLFENQRNEVVEVTFLNESGNIESIGKMDSGKSTKITLKLRHGVFPNALSGAYEIGVKNEYAFYRKGTRSDSPIGQFTAYIAGRQELIQLPTFHELNKARLKPVLILKCEITEDGSKWCQVPESAYLKPTYELIG
ncbi:MAG: hypothetical protein EP346_05745 [Bacteroidetes bacterium]|nr:MAG: hypothetical protein EP346_05745 [Bacteroidota bacterium]